MSDAITKSASIKANPFAISDPESSLFLYFFVASCYVLLILAGGHNGSASASQAVSEHPQFLNK
jgi:hypothetical protein